MTCPVPVCVTGCRVALWHCDAHAFLMVVPILQGVAIFRTEFHDGLKPRHCIWSYTIQSRHNKRSPERDYVGPYNAE